ncbi:MAG: hypothetical protein L0I24_17975, partial [Pseudonocardia sp.]|nr:hypothetical protein [Pseudonocardia sp.]
PFVTAIAAEMLADLRADIAADPQRRVVFLGRDAYSYAAAIRGLDPEFFAAHASEIVLSRVLVDAALQDLERHTGATFDSVEPFRVRTRVHPSEVDGAAQALTDYLDDAAVPITTPGSTVTLVDNSFKGTIQELLTAAYPDTTFTGRYALHATHPDDPHPDDPHPDSKTGYAFHQPAGARWRGIPEAQLPTEPELTFGAADALAVIEDTLNGPDSSPRTITGGRPVQHPLRGDPEPLRGLNPALVAPDWHDPAVRAAIKTAALLAVADAATGAAPTLAGAPGPALRAHRLAVQQNFSTQTRAWIQHDRPLDPALGELLDSFVLRADHAQLAALHDTLAQTGVTETAAAPIWERLARSTGLDETAALVDDTIAALTAPAREPRRTTGATLAPAGELGPDQDIATAQTLQQLVRGWRRRQAAENDLLDGISRRGGYPDRPDPPHSSLHHRS